MRHPASQVSPIALPIAVLFMILGILVATSPRGMAGPFDAVSNTSSSPVDPRTDAPLPPANPVAPQPVAVPMANGGQAVVPNTGKYPPEVTLPPSQGIQPKTITVGPNSGNNTTH